MVVVTLFIPFALRHSFNAPTCSRGLCISYFSLVQIFFSLPHNALYSQELYVLQYVSQVIKQLEPATTKTQDNLTTIKNCDRQ